MAKLMVTWLGEDELHEPLPGPSFTQWGETRFYKDRPVLIDTDKQGVSADERLVLQQIVARASKNRFFKVEQERAERQSKG